MSLKLIKHKDYLLLVDTEAKISVGEYLVSIFNNKIQFIDVCTEVDEQLDIINYNGKKIRWTCGEDCAKIIAATPKLGDLPLLPKLPKQEEDVAEKVLNDQLEYHLNILKQVQKVLEHNPTNEYNLKQQELQRSIIITITTSLGLYQAERAKAASKKWSDEDMKKRILEYAKWLTGGPKSMSFAATSETAIKRILQSLSPTEVVDFIPEYELIPYFPNVNVGDNPKRLKIIDGKLQGKWIFKD